MKSPKITLSKFEQEIDLKELFGVDLSDDDSLKQAIGQFLIDRMLERVDSGKGIGGVKLKSPYSKEYSKSLEFKAAGKSRGKVNMSLTGDMLASIDLLSTDGNKIKIGIEDDSLGSPPCRAALDGRSSGEDLPRGNHRPPAGPCRYLRRSQSR